MVIMFYVPYLEKKIPIDKLTYWNVELQEAYFSYREASAKREKEI